MIEKALANGAELPIKIIEVNILGFILPFDIRHSVIDDYVAQGKLEVLQIVSPNVQATMKRIRYANTMYVMLFLQVGLNLQIIFADMWVASTI